MTSANSLSMPESILDLRLNRMEPSLGLVAVKAEGTTKR